MNSDLVQLAEKLMRHIQNRLFMQYRFLEPAIYKLTLKECDATPARFGTDGDILLYDPLDWLKRFQNDSILEIRRYLHTIFHCIFLHPFFSPQSDETLWEISCDIAVEAAILLQLNTFTLPCDIQKKSVINKIQTNVPLLTVQEIYKYIKKTPIDLNSLKRLFGLDTHLWMPKEKEKFLPHTDDHDHTDMNGDFQIEHHIETTDAPMDVELIHTDIQHVETARGQDDADWEVEDAASFMALSKAKTPQLPSPSQQCLNAWKEAARAIQVDMKSFHSQGSSPGMIEKTLDYLTRDEMDYTEFLQQFAVMEEKMMINPDEFDYMYYMYGLRLPGHKKLLIEPLEYRDTKLIREFIIAIDSSGSCAGNLVKKFLNKTYSILKSTEMFTSAVNIHIIQSDARIQDDTVIHSLEEIEHYANNFKVKGCGGTDFRPVFEHVEKLRSDGEFKNLCGLIYFTDGFGTFPEKPTDYKTAFVFLDKYSNFDVPEWAFKAIWTEEN